VEVSARLGIDYCGASIEMGLLYFEYLMIVVPRWSFTTL
jgi:hypothetical protein